MKTPARRNVKRKQPHSIHVRFSDQERAAIAAMEHATGWTATRCVEFQARAGRAALSHAKADTDRLDIYLQTLAVAIRCHSQAEH